MFKYCAYKKSYFSKFTHLLFIYLLLSVCTKNKVQFVNIWIYFFTYTQNANKSNLILYFIIRRIMYNN